jgi:hypothetical protein
MDFLKAMLARARPVLDGLAPHVEFSGRVYAKDSRIHGVLTVDSSLDLPGDLDAVVASAASLAGLGNSSDSGSPPSS